MRRSLFPCLILLALLFGAVQAMGRTKDISISRLEPADSTGRYSFFTGGHLYGAHGNVHSIYPSASFCAHVHDLALQKPVAFFALGDILRSAKDAEAIAAFKKVASHLDAPFFNAPGNHDLDDPQAYAQAFGPVHQAFWIGKDLLVLLNTEALADPGDPTAESFVGALERAIGQNEIRNLLVFSHRNLPAASQAELAEMDDLANAPLAESIDQKRAKVLFESLLEIPYAGERWWFVGDVGTHWSVPLLYGEVPGLKVVAVGVGDTEEDALLEVVVNENGDVMAKPYPLAGQELGELESYTSGYWKGKGRGKNEGMEWNGRLSALIGQESFWLGMLGGILLLASGFFLRRRWGGKAN